MSTASPIVPPRSEVASSEATCNPIFLLQRALTKPHSGRDQRWTVESVWLTREEGEEFGRRTHYRYPYGWRVYCVPASGALADVLRDGWPTPEPSPPAGVQPHPFVVKLFMRDCGDCGLPDGNPVHRGQGFA